MRTRALISRTVLGVALGAVGAGGCTDTDPMNAQNKYQPYERSDFFADSRAMRPLLEDTVPQEWRARVVPGPSGETGLMPDGTWARRVPVPLTRELLETGRARYEAFCAVCHGLNGDGESIVAMNMEARRPPSLIAPHDHTREVVYGSAEERGPYPDKRYVGANAVSPSMRAVIADGVLEKDRRDRPGPLDEGRPDGGPIPPGGLAAGRPSTTGMETREAPDASTPLPLGEGQGEGRGPQVTGAPDAGRPDAGGGSQPGRAGATRDGGLGGPASGGTPHSEAAFDTPAAANARQAAGDGQYGVSLTGRSVGPATAGDLPHPPGYYFAVITDGYGVMPAYAETLTPRERWAVVAWLRVLARSQSAPLDSAPPEVRQKLLQSLQGGTTP